MWCRSRPFETVSGEPALSLRRKICRRRGRASSGFTLVEVLVTLAVLAISLGAIGSLMSANMRAVGALERHLSLTETGRALWTALPDRNGPAIESLSGELAGQRWRLIGQPYADGFVDKASPSPWEPRFVTLRVLSPTGAMLQIETVRLQRRADR